MRPATLQCLRRHAPFGARLQRRPLLLLQLILEDDHQAEDDHQDAEILEPRHADLELVGPHGAHHAHDGHADEGGGRGVKAHVHRDHGGVGVLVRPVQHWPGHEGADHHLVEQREVDRGRQREALGHAPLHEVVVLGVAEDLVQRPPREHRDRGEAQQDDAHEDGPRDRLQRRVLGPEPVHDDEVAGRPCDVAEEDQVADCPHQEGRVRDNGLQLRAQRVLLLQEEDVAAGRGGLGRPAVEDHHEDGAEGGDEDAERLQPLQLGLAEDHRQQRGQDGQEGLPRGTRHWVGELQGHEPEDLVEEKRCAAQQQRGDVFPRRHGAHFENEEACAQRDQRPELPEELEDDGARAVHSELSHDGAPREQAVAGRERGVDLVDGGAFLHRELPLQRLAGILARRARPVLHVLFAGGHGPLGARGVRACVEGCVVRYGAIWIGQG
mmetsp:Transcript_51096/g.132935  ORF Transcript_51096/g.132935 Transcript_51096/m.132935 type:complete len:438 (-) Transcript_51096:42-1355(-)